MNDGPYGLFQNTGQSAWDAVEEGRLGLQLDTAKPVVVQFWSVPGGVGNQPVLQHQMVLHGKATLMNNEIMAKKANVVAMTGRTPKEAIESATELGVSYSSWLPNGTDFWGSAPVFSVTGELLYVVVVSGQKHKEFDQPFASYIATGLEQHIAKHTIAVG